MKAREIRIIKEKHLPFWHKLNEDNRYEIKKFDDVWWSVVDRKARNFRDMELWLFVKVSEIEAAVMVVQNQNEGSIPRPMLLTGEGEHVRVHKDPH